MIIVLIPGFISKKTVSLFVNPWVPVPTTVTTFLVIEPFTISLFFNLKLWIDPIPTSKNWISSKVGRVPVKPNPNLTPVDPKPTLTVDNPIRSSVFLITNKVVPIPTLDVTVGVAVKNFTFGATSDPLTPFNS